MQRTYMMRPNRLFHLIPLHTINCCSSEQEYTLLCRMLYLCRILLFVAVYFCIQFVHFRIVVLWK